MLLTVVIVGGLVLVCLSLTVGQVDGRSRRTAWKHIATERRRIWEAKRELLAWEERLRSADEDGVCTRCRLIPPDRWQEGA